MRSLPQLIAKYLETGTGDIQTLASGFSGGTVAGNTTFNGNVTFAGSITTINNDLTVGGNFSLTFVDMSGTPGNVTSFGPITRVTFPLSTSSLVITATGRYNANSMGIVNFRGFDTTATRAICIGGTNTMTITLNAPCTAALTMDVWVLN